MAVKFKIGQIYRFTTETIDIIFRCTGYHKHEYHIKILENLGSDQSNWIGFSEYSDMRYGSRSFPQYDTPLFKVL
jgi:hypothetical protein